MPMENQQVIIYINDIYPNVKYKEYNNAKAINSWVNTDTKIKAGHRS